MVKYNDYDDYYNAEQSLVTYNDYDKHVSRAKSGKI